jgi:hypothetical protein
MEVSAYGPRNYAMTGGAFQGSCLRLMKNLCRLSISFPVRHQGYWLLLFEETKIVQGGLSFPLVSAAESQSLNAGGGQPVLLPFAQ